MAVKAEHGDTFRAREIHDRDHGDSGRGVGFFREETNKATADFPFEIPHVPDRVRALANLYW